MKNFRTYQIAIEFIREASKLKLPGYLRDQLDRAASSIALNLAEGAGRYTKKDQRKFFIIAMGSLRECQAILDIRGVQEEYLLEIADSLGAHLFKLIKSA